VVAPITTRIKICGITRPEDALSAASLGADAIGLVFYEPSPRNVDIDQACAIVNALPPFVTRVGLFVDAKPEQIRQVLDKVGLDLLQFHGDESPQDCEEYNLPYIKAIRMRDGVDLADEARLFNSASGLLLDAFQSGVPGGTGQSFDWTRVTSSVQKDLAKPVILAGGLVPANVGEAIFMVQPYAVDVSGGVESAKGVKDQAKMAAFVEAVRAADRISDIDHGTDHSVDHK
jgi:phosphoribosylanthranilate isomerase